MKLKYLYLLMYFLILFISGCVGFSNNPYIKEVYTEPSFIDYSTQSSKIIYTIYNPSQIDFDGKISLTYDDKCLNIQDETEVKVAAEKEIPGTISIQKAYSLKEECYKDQQIILNLINKKGDIIYHTTTTNIKLISN